MASPIDLSSFKEISIVPDYRALEIIQANKKELSDFYATGEPIIRELCQEPEYTKFRKKLNAVEEYLSKKEAKYTLTTTIASGIGADLKKFFRLSKEEIVMTLNQLPLSDTHLEMMFPGRFNKVEQQAMIKLIHAHLGLPEPTEAMAVTEDGEEVEETEVKPHL